jgi:hypothetical protein
MTIASHMRTLVDHQDFVPRLGEGAADDGAAESGSDDAIPHGDHFRSSKKPMTTQSIVDSKPNRTEIAHAVVTLS